MNRRKCRVINVGGVQIGGDSRITIQSMTNTKTSDVEATVKQINELCAAGCEIVRVAVPDEEAARAIEKIKQRVTIPLVADIHFDYKLAILSALAGADKIRINPGNIGSDENVKRVADACKQRGIPIRIGINSGSLEKNILAKYGKPCAEAMVESALYHCSLLEKANFNDICISIKSSDVAETVQANILLAEKCDYPIHLGVTESGVEEYGIVKSSAGIGGLLCMGIGDTVRVSLTANPVREVEAAKRILKAVGVRRGVNIISCPTCGRCKVDLIPIAEEVSARLKNVKSDITVAVMGCAVNGPGEAAGADVGITGGDNCGLLFVKGQIKQKYPREKLVDALIDEVERLTGEKI